MTDLAYSDMPAPENEADAGAKILRRRAAGPAHLHPGVLRFA